MQAMTFLPPSSKEGCRGALTAPGVLGLAPLSLWLSLRLLRT